MKINFSFIITVFINTTFLIIALLFISTSSEDYKNTIQHYQTVSKIQAHNFNSNIIDSVQNETTNVDKESDNVYIVKTKYKISIPVLFYEENRYIETYISK